jgi:hypothetical protein
MGADCLGDDGDTDGGPADRKSCEDVCDAEAQCSVRSKADCEAALCSDTGFKTVDSGDDETDLAELSSNDCEKTAEDCGALVKCSCPDSCARVDQCTGSSDASCVDDCDTLIEAESDFSVYLENRCKMESACADLAACGSSG